MLKITGYTIRMTRGDTARIALSILDKEGNEYITGPDDVVWFSVKRYLDDEAYLIKKNVLHGEIVIEPADTSGLEVGGPYWYDVQVTLENGDVSTVIGPNQLWLEGEVTV